MAVAVLVAGTLMCGAAWAAHQGLSADDHVGLDRTVTVGDLRVTVAAFERRVDAVAGVNAEAVPLSGPAMPMGMGGLGMGRSGHDMADMPGMAGMLHDGQERVDVRLTVVNDGEQSSVLRAERFRLTSGGRPVPLLQRSTSEIAGPLAPGFSLAGTVTFVVAEGTAPLVLHYGDDEQGVVLDAGHAPHGGGDHDHDEPHSGGDR